MNIEISVTSAIFIVAGIGAIQFLAAELIKARLQKSIDHEYAKKLEEYKLDIRLRENAARIAEALARYHHGNGKDTRGFMQLIWELSIYLPSDLVCDLTTHLVEHRTKKTNPKDLIVKVRKLFHGKSDVITAENLVHLEPQNNEG